MSEFSDRPFVAGSLVGVRSFRVDEWGRLIGPSYPDVWKPGENVAVCHRSVESSLGGLFLPALSQFTLRMDAFSLYGPHYTVAPSEVEIPKAPPVNLKKKPKPPPHHVGMLSCQCGYYAYFDTANNPHHNKGNVHAIIEGYGTITVGSRGFRAEKAKLLAVVIKPKRWNDATSERLRHNYPDVRFFGDKGEAFDAFPLIAPPTPTPETCPDFWSKRVPS